MNRKLKWSEAVRESHETACDDVRSHEGRKMREIPDLEINSLLTLWRMKSGSTLIMQTFLDTGDVCFYASIRSAEDAAELDRR